MEKQIERQCRANAVFTDEAYLKTRYICREDGTYTIRVGRGERRDVLACKELYGKAVKTALELDCTACAFDLGPASELGQNGLFAAAEGVCGGAYRKKFALSGRWEPELACSFPGADAEGEQVQKAWQLARSIMETRDLVNCPANLLRPEMLAQKLKDMPVYSAMQSLQSVTFPALSRIGSDEAKFAEGYRRVIMVTAFVMFPAMAGLIATADDIYTLLLKPDWRPAIPYFRIMCLAGIFYPLSMIAYNILKVKSDGSIILRLEIVKRAMTTLILIVTIPRSVEAVAWGLAASAACEAAVNMLAARRYASLGIARTLRTLLPITVLTLSMYAAVVCGAHFAAHWHVATRLAAEIVLGATVYAAGAFATRMEAFYEVRTLVAKLRGKNEAA